LLRYFLIIKKRLHKFSDVGKLVHEASKLVDWLSQIKFTNFWGFPFVRTHVRTSDSCELICNMLYYPDNREAFFNCFGKDGSNYEKVYRFDHLERAIVINRLQPGVFETNG